eukprot:gb/GEZN01012827.1/.p1 GENE.gb/GEZN01012827.1/~~gb/GEZN01012827.1/.p1  ORF type:complete len:329 (-),score=57.89 gb/GEZN01012827.1/:66-1007(-)
MSHRSTAPVVPAEAAPGKLDSADTKRTSSSPDHKAQLSSFVQSSVFAISEKHGRRYQEDRWLIRAGFPAAHTVMLGVFDGHDGEACSDACTQYLMRLPAPKAVQQPNSDWLQDLFQSIHQAVVAPRPQLMRKCGSTATLMFFRPGAGPDDVQLSIAYAGDSPVFFVRQDGSVVQITTDHHPLEEAERRRVESTGQGRIRSDNSLWMGSDFLRMTRSFGDLLFVPCGKLHEPDVLHFRPKDLSGVQFVLVASDGWLDGTNLKQQASEFNRLMEKEGGKDGRGWQQAVRELVVNRKSPDNTTIIALRLPHDTQPR